MTHTCGNPSDKGEDVLLWRCLYSLPPWEKSTTRQWKCSKRNRGGKGLFLSTLVSPPSLTNQAWNGRNIKCSRFHSSPAGSRLGLLHLGKCHGASCHFRLARNLPSASPVAAATSLYVLQVRSEGLKKRPVHCEIHRGLSDSVPAPHPASQAQRASSLV